MSEEEIVEFINRTGEKRSAYGLNALNEVERVAELVSWVDYEIVMGGLLGFYGNSASNDIFAMIDALHKINAHDAADALEASTRLFGDTSRVADRDFRSDVMDRMDWQSPEWDAVEKQYWAQKPDMVILLYDYLRAHLDKGEV